MNTDFRELADIKEPTELVHLRKTLAETDVKQREETNRQERGRGQIKLEKEKNERERERINREAEIEWNQLEASIKQLEITRDRTVAELEKFDCSLARFFQVETPHAWSQASKTLNRETLFQSVDDLGAKKSSKNTTSAWGVEFSTETLPDSLESYNREELSSSLQTTKKNLSLEHDKLQAARDRYLAASSELDKKAVQTQSGWDSEIETSIELRRTFWMKASARRTVF